MTKTNYDNLNSLTKTSITYASFISLVSLLLIVSLLFVLYSRTGDFGGILWGIALRYLLPVVAFIAFGICLHVVAFRKEKTNLGRLLTTISTVVLTVFAAVNVFIVLNMYS